MKANGGVSVVVPAYNSGAFLPSALESIFRQGSAVRQVIVVDDGSEEDLGGVLAPFRARIELVTQTNRGPAAARNAGVRRAGEEYLAFLDADDLWSDHVIGRARERLSAARHLDGVHALTRILTASPAHPIERPDAYFGTACSETWSAAGQPWRSPQVGSLLVRRRWFERFPFDESLRLGEDFEWFLRGRDASARLESMDEVMLLYRLHGSMSTRGRNAVERNTLAVLKRALDRRRDRTDTPC